jgi:surface protein
MRLFLFSIFLLASCSDVYQNEPFEHVEKAVKGGLVEITELSDGRVKLEAIGYDLHTFRSWSGDLSSHENPLYLTANNDDIVLRPNFEKILGFHDNNHTIICNDARVGDKAKIDGIEFVVADKELITNYITESKPLDNLCTSKLEGDLNHFFDNVMENYGSWDNVGDITHWDVSQVTSTDFLFSKSDFNQNISNWDVSNVTSMNMMFCFASEFNHDLNNWDVSHVKNLVGTFLGARSFNGNIEDWELRAAINMDQMFKLASSYKKSLNTWCIEQVTEVPKEFHTGSPLTQNKLPRWGSCTS